MTGRRVHTRPAAFSGVPAPRGTSEKGALLITPLAGTACRFPDELGKEMDMTNQDWGRRAFLDALGTAGIYGLVGANRADAAAEPPPETTRLRIADQTAPCFAPLFVAEDLLRVEGFSDVTYVQREKEVGADTLLTAGEADIAVGTATTMLPSIDAGQPLVLVAGAHVGCFKLFAPRRIRAIRELKGKVVGLPWRGGYHQITLSLILANIGINPAKDVEWREEPRWPERMRLLEEEKIDGYLGHPPEPQELQARKIGHVVFDTTTDRPWSQYFCCMVAMHRDFVHRHPVATKRALRALLKGADVCAAEPERAARIVAAHNPAFDPRHVLQMIRDLPYGAWREFRAEDTARFYALRLHELGMIKSSPQKLLAQGTDWRFVDALKRELKT